MDESLSMEFEHAVIGEAMRRLENAFLALGIGSTPSAPNLYGLVGYGRAETSSLNGQLGHVFSFKDGRTMAPFSDFEQVTSQLLEDNQGSEEDGYQAIEHALENIALRNTPNVRGVLILVSDEDRDVSSEGQGITRESIQTYLKEKQFVLHVIVENSFIANGMLALGINSTRWAFVVNDNDDVVESQGVQIGPGYRGTRADYTELALDLNGTAWDINLFRHWQYFSVLTDKFTDVVAMETYVLGSKCPDCGMRIVHDVSMCRAARKIHSTGAAKVNPLWPPVILAYVWLSVSFSNEKGWNGQTKKRLPTETVVAGCRPSGWVDRWPGAVTLIL